MGMIGNTLAQGLISGANIQDGTVDTPDIKDGAVTTAKIADGAVVTQDIADSAVTAAKIADGVVTPGKLSTGAMTWDSSYRVMIGTSTSNTFGGNLEVVTGVSYNSSPNTSLVLGGTDNGYVDSGKASTYRFTVTGNATNQNLSIDRFLRGTGWTTSAVFDGSGNFSLGTTNTSNGRATIYNASGNTLSLQKSGGAAGLMFGSDTTNYALIESINGGGFNFYTGSGTQTVRASIDANGLTVNSRINPAYTSVGNLASGSISGLTSGIRRYSFSIQGDNVWRTLVSSINDTTTLMYVLYLSDAASTDMAMYTINMNSPAYGVYSMTQVFYNDGGWNTGTFQFQFASTGGNGIALQVRFASYYSTSATATGNIMFVTA